jgi:hypothetical protein
VFVPRTSSTPVDTWFWQTKGRSVERVILGVRPSEFILLEFQSPSRRIFIGSYSLPPLWSPNRSFKNSRSNSANSTDHLTICPTVSRLRKISPRGKLSYGPPWAHYLRGYQDRLLGGPLGLPTLCRTVPVGVRRKDYGGEVLG